MLDLLTLLKCEAFLFHPLNCDVAFNITYVSKLQNHWNASWRTKGLSLSLQLEELLMNWRNFSRCLSQEEIASNEIVVTKLLYPPLVTSIMKVVPKTLLSTDSYVLGWRKMHWVKMVLWVNMHWPFDYLTRTIKYKYKSRRPFNLYLRTPYISYVCEGGGGEKEIDLVLVWMRDILPSS